MKSDLFLHLGQMCFPENRLRGGAGRKAQDRCTTCHGQIQVFKTNGAEEIESVLAQRSRVCDRLQQVRNAFPCRYPRYS